MLIGFKILNNQDSICGNISLLVATADGYRHHTVEMTDKLVIGIDNIEVDSIGVHSDPNITF